MLSHRRRRWETLVLAGRSLCSVLVVITHRYIRKVLGESTLTLMSWTVGALEVKFHCAHGLFNATVKLLGLAEGELDILSCTVERPAGQGCTVGEGANKLILALVHLQLSSGLMPATGLITGTKGTGEELAKFAIAGASCSVKNTYTLTGLQTVEFPGRETSLVEHEIVAKKSGSKLKLGTEVASFSNKTKVHLASGSSFLIMLGV